MTVPLMLMGDSNPDGTAVLTANGEGTHVKLDISGLEPNTTAPVMMHAGTCRAPGASGAQLPPLTVGEDGRATSTGMSLFRGTENIPLRDIADGAHSISIGGGTTLACGTIPDLAAVGADQSQPNTPATSEWLSLSLFVLIMALAVMGVLAFRTRRMTN